MQDQVASNWAIGSLWTIVVFIGALALFGAIVYAWRRNKDVTPREHRRSEEATRDLYKDPVDTDSFNR